MKINNAEIQGKIGELIREYNINCFFYNDLKNSINALEKISKNINTPIGCDIETQGLYAWKHDMLGLVISYDRNKAIYFNVRNWSDNDIVELIKKFNSLKNIKVFHNSIFDSPFTGIRYGIPLKCDADTLTIYHELLTNRQYYDKGLGLKDLTRDFLPFGDYESELEIFKSKYSKENSIKKADFTYDLIPDEILIPYAIMDVISTLALYKKSIKIVRKKFYSNDWKGLANVIDIKHKVNKYYIDAKVKGIKVDREKIKELYNDWDKHREEILNELMSIDEVKITEKIIKREELIKAQGKRKSLLPLSRCRKIWNETKFNFSSSNHKVKLFFDVMKLKPVEKTKKGNIGCGAETISHYSKKGIKIFELLDEYSKMDKGISAFLGLEGDKGLWNLTSDEHSYIHSTHNINGTISGRSTTYDVNLAQIPSRGILKKVKQCFTVGDDYKFMAFDWKAMESRFSTVQSQEPSLKKAFAEDLDMHSLTAYGVYKDKMELPHYGEFDIELQDYIKENYGNTWRQDAKVVSFGILYGMSGGALGKTLNISKKEADVLIENYFKSNTFTNNMINENKLNLCNKGYHENRYGARIYLENAFNYNPLKDRHYTKKNWEAIKEHRLCTNYDIQGSCAYYLYQCMNSFFEEVKNIGLDISLMMTIYDSFMVKVRKGIDNEVVTKLFFKHFARELDGVLLDIDAFMSSDGTWYNYEKIKLNKPKNFKPLGDFEKIKDIENLEWMWSYE